MFPPPPSSGLRSVRTPGGGSVGFKEEDAPTPKLGGSSGGMGGGTPGVGRCQPGDQVC